LGNRLTRHERLQIVDFALIIEGNRQKSNWMPTLTVHKIHGVHSSLIFHQILLRTAFLVDPEPGDADVVRIAENSLQNFVSDYILAETFSARSSHVVLAIAIAFKS
jgi:hypothetical protein